MSKRAVVLDSGTAAARRSLCKRALASGLDVVGVAVQAADALHMVASGQADVILVRQAKTLQPVIQVLGGSA